MNFKSYDEAVKHLESFIGKIRFEITPELLKHHNPLEPMRVLLSLLGNPQDKFPSVLIGGTSGKGSTAYLISHILTTAGYKTGLTISPHLQKVNERLQINGKSISDEKFTEIVSSIVDTIELMKKTKVGEPSYFEIIIAMAFLYFVKEKVDIAVVEVGMGGEYDATNTLYPLVAVLTNISLDHTNVLGGTVKMIAKTKAGIIKKYQISNIKYQINTNKETPKRLIVITGATQPSVIKIVEDKCKEVGAEVFRLYKGFNFKIKKEGLGGSVFDLTTTHDRGLQLNDLSVALLGRYQVENASLAIETVLQLGKFVLKLAEMGFKVSEVHIRKTLKTAFMSLKDAKILRYKDIKNKKIKSPNILISQHPNIQIVVDGAHNPTKMKSFLTTLKKLYPKERKIFVVGFKFDKDVKKMLRQILQVADILIVTEFRAKTDISTNASIDTKRILEDIKRLRYYDIKKIIVERDSRKAFNRALNILVSQYPNINTIIVVTGSLYLVGEIRDFIML